MALKLEDKKAIVVEVTKIATGSTSAIIADARGVTVDAMTSLRKQAREGAVYLKVVRNTLARIALKGTEHECLLPELVGPSLLAFSQEHPGVGARLLTNFAKQHKAFTVRAAAFEGALTDVNILAKLPTRNEAIVQLINVLKEASIGKLVRTFAALRDLKAQQAST